MQRWALGDPSASGGGLATSAFGKEQRKNSSGGESQMIKIVIVRSDTHLREVLRFYERRFGRNFARDMIDKSRNLVVSSSSSQIYCIY